MGYLPIDPDRLRTVNQGEHMQIMKLVLCNYTRLFLNGITKVTYTPESSIQILLGQNGSGKSSLLEQLTPIAPNLKKDYRDGGSKEITIKHNDSIYVLLSEAGSGHSFVVDGEELNESRTISVQNKLTETHFGITPQIQQVLLGKKRLTNMSYNERKRWITDMSSIDYSYPVAVYSNIKKRHRDIVGGIKLLQNNIVKIKKSALPEDVINALRVEREHLSLVIDHLLSLTTPGKNPGNLDSLIKEVTAISNKLLGHASEDSDMKSLEESLVGVKAKSALYKDSIMALNRELAELNAASTKPGLDDVEARISVLEAKIAKVMGSVELPELEDPEHTVAYITSNYGDITSLLSSLSEYGGLDVSLRALTVATDTKRATESLMATLTKEQYKVSARLSSLIESSNPNKEVECPKCSNKWNPGYTKEEHDNCHKRVSDLGSRLKEVTDQFEAVSTRLAGIESVRSTIAEFSKYFSYSDDTRALLTHMRSNDIYKIGGHATLFQVFEFCVNELHSVGQAVTYRKELEKLISIRSEVVAVAESEVAGLESRKDALVGKVESYRSLVDETVSKTLDLERRIRNKVKYAETMAELKSALNLVYRCKDDHTASIRNKLLGNGIRELRSDMLDITDKLKGHDEYTTMLNRYKDELIDLECREKVLKVTLVELGPSEGLIAKSVSSFLNIFIQDVNSVISTIWGYDMELLPCDLGEYDLDYKFRVMVNGDEVIEDVTKTSSSMQEIIDLVFKLVFYKYMGLDGYPLILDEFGRTFDSQHRITSYQELERNISGNFSQVYMVSHFESMYGRFGNADVSILGTAGVDMDTIDKYNEVMDIAY